MRCPNCDGYIEIEDIADETPFECEHCLTTLRLVPDRLSDNDEPRLEVIDEDEEALVKDVDDDYEDDVDSDFVEYDEETDDDDFEDNYNDEYDPYY